MKKIMELKLNFLDLFYIFSTCEYNSHLEFRFIHENLKFSFE